MKIRLIAPAKADMTRIWAYYEKQRPGLGSEFLDDLGAAVRLVGEYPLGQPEFWKDARGASCSSASLTAPPIALWTMKFK